TASSDHISDPEVARARRRACAARDRTRAGPSRPRCPRSVILAELVIAPILLAIVFLGAVAIGRRVATPIELARRRQLEFTADASHELRTPLSVIEAQTSLALVQDRAPAWYRVAFERVDRESKRMRRLVDDLLWLARFDATQAPGHAEPVDLGVLAAQAADRFGVIASAHDLRLEVRTPPRGRSSRRRRSGSIGCWVCCSTTPASTPPPPASSRSPWRTRDSASG
ncbi:MAG: HAMP domain-containing histidine kinase, partial [Chloroflexota bacterium]|nr:HAMP domain-containing histidine kinase [Chloroflexota bacterium]